MYAIQTQARAKPSTYWLYLLSTVDLCLGHLLLYPPIMAENNSWKPDEDDDEEEIEETVSTR